MPEEPPAWSAHPVEIFAYTRTVSAEAAMRLRELCDERVLVFQDQNGNWGCAPDMKETPMPCRAIVLLSPPDEKDIGELNAIS